MCHDTMVKNHCSNSFLENVLPKLKSQIRVILKLFEFTFFVAIILCFRESEKNEIG